MTSEHVHEWMPRQQGASQRCSCGAVEYLDAARLSHERGADALNAAHEYVFCTDAVCSLCHHSCALSVPAPTLPALDADPVERFWLRIATESIPRGTTVQAYRRSILRRLDEARAEKREVRDAV